MWEQIGGSRERGDHNQDIACEKNIFFQYREKSPTVLQCNNMKLMLKYDKKLNRSKVLSYYLYK